MKWIFALCLLVATVVMTGSGCVTSVDGRLTPGVPFTTDKVEGRYERPVMDVWAAANDVLELNGHIYSRDVLKSTLEASINKRTVWVRVEPVDPKVTRVTVQARTSLGGADVPLAAEMDKQIALRLATGNLTPSNPSASK